MKNKGVRVSVYIYIYMGGFFSNFMVIGSYLGRVSGFFDKTRTRPRPALIFFFLIFKPIPDPILYRAE